MCLCACAFNLNNVQQIFVLKQWVIHSLICLKSTLRFCWQTCLWCILFNVFIASSAEIDSAGFTSNSRAMYLVAMATDCERIVTLYVYYRNAKMHLKVWLTKSTGLVWPPQAQTSSYSYDEKFFWEPRMVLLWNHYETLLEPLFLWHWCKN